jgi:hypothetical protein
MEFVRQTLQEIEELEQIACCQLLGDLRKHKNKISAQTKVKDCLNQISYKSKLLTESYNQVKEESNEISIDSFTEFYKRLKSVKDFYRTRNEPCLPFNPKQPLTLKEEQGYCL